jgi:hypothetical protein
MTKIVAAVVEEKLRGSFNLLSRSGIVVEAELVSECSKI